MFGRRKTPKISHRHTLPGYLLGFIVVIGLAGLAAMYWFPTPMADKGVSEVQVEPLQQEILRQIKVINKLDQDRNELLKRIVQLERMSQIDRESVSRIQDELKSDQNERIKLEEELLFLRGIVSSKNGSGVLHLRHLRLKQGKGENSVYYTFTISKVLRDQKYIEGLVYFTVSGKQDGVKRTLPLKAVTGNKQESLKLRFKHFQKVEGEFLLPSGFKPSDVTIEIKPADKKYSPIKRSFKWVVLS